MTARFNIGVVAEDLGEVDEALRPQLSPTTGGALVYLMDDGAKGRAKLPVLGYSSYVPQAALGAVPEAPAFVVVHESEPDAVVIDVQGEA